MRGFVPNITFLILNMSDLKERKNYWLSPIYDWISFEYDWVDHIFD